MVSNTVLEGRANVTLNANSGSVTAGAQGSNFVLSVSPGDIANYARQGNDLVIELTNGQSVTIQDFFVNGPGYHNLVLSNGNQLSLVDFTSAMGGADGIVDAVVATEAVTGAGGLSTAAIVGLGALAAGGIAAAASSSSSDDNDYSGGGGGTPPPPPSTVTDFASVVESAVATGDTVFYKDVGNGIADAFGATFFSEAVNVTAFAKALAGNDAALQTSIEAAINGATNKVDEAANKIVDFITAAKAVSGAVDSDIAKSVEEAIEAIAGATNTTVDMDAVASDIEAATVLPPLPTFFVVDNVGSIVGNLSDGAVTDGNNLRLEGTAKAGTIIEIFSDQGGGISLGTATVSGNGFWVFPSMSTNLVDGSRVLTIKITDPDNGKVNETTFNLTVDTSSPAGLTITEARDDVAPGLGLFNQNATINDDMPFFRGQVNAGEATKVKVYDGIISSANLLGEATVAADGSWMFQVPTALSGGSASSVAGDSHTIKFVAIDEAGNESAPVDYVFTVDTFAPVVGESDARVTKIEGVGGVDLLDNAFINAAGNASIDVAGKGEVGAIVTITRDGVKLTDVTVDANGDWSYTIAGGFTGNDGGHNLSFTISDAYGNEAVLSSHDITLDKTPPVGAMDATFTGVISGSSHNTVDSVYSTDVVKATFKTTAVLADGEVVRVDFGDGKWVTALKDSTDSANLTWVATGNIPDGTAKTVTARVEDLAGNFDGSKAVASKVGLTSIKSVVIDETTLDSSAGVTHTLDNAAHDILKYAALDTGALDKDTGGHKTDIIQNFQMGTWGTDTPADRIDISELLVGATINNAADLAKYLTAANVGGNLHVSIDRDGSDASQYASAHLFTLNGLGDQEATFLNDLWLNNQIIV